MGKGTRFCRRWKTLRRCREMCIRDSEYTELIEGFQAQIFNFTHDSDTWQAINDYSLEPTDQNAARIAIQAQTVKATDEEILNCCLDDTQGRLITNIKYAEVEQRAILEGLNG